MTIVEKAQLLLDRARRVLSGPEIRALESILEDGLDADGTMERLETEFAAYLK